MAQSRRVQGWLRRGPLALAAVAALAILASVAVACGGVDVDSSSADAVTTSEMTVSSTAVIAEDARDDTDAAVSVEIVDPWARLPAMGQSVAAAYLSVTNIGESAVTLRGAESSFARVELHETIAADDGVMSMRERTEGFEIEAGDTLVMEPGGIHVMLIGVERDQMLLVGEIPIDLDFGPAGLVSVMAEVRDGAKTDHGGMNHSGMDHGGMDHGAGIPGDPDVNAMHRLDDELHAGVLDVDRQRATVAEFRAAVIAAEILNAERLAEMLDALDRLDEELANGDVSAAAAVAFEVHDLAHDYIDHH